MEIASGLIGGLTGGLIAALIGAYVGLRQQARQHTHELAMSREARFADRIRELAARLILLGEGYPPALREQLSRRDWETGRLPVPDVDRAFYGVARELHLLLKSSAASDALNELVSAVARVDSFLSCADRPGGGYTVLPMPTNEDAREANGAIERFCEAMEACEPAIRSELRVEGLDAV